MTHALYINAEQKGLLVAALDLYLARVTLTSRQRAEFLHLRYQAEFCTNRENPNDSLRTSRTPKNVGQRGIDRRANVRKAGA
jgi:hypothetical protein